MKKLLETVATVGAALLISTNIPGMASMTTSDAYKNIDEQMKQISGCEIHVEEVVKHVGEHEVKGSNGDTDLVKSIYSEVEYLYNELFMSQVNELMSNFNI